MFPCKAASACQSGAHVLACLLAWTTDCWHALLTYDAACMLDEQWPALHCQLLVPSLPVIGCRRVLCKASAAPS